MNPEQKENTTPETETPEQPAPAPETPETPEKKDDKKGIFGNSKKLQQELEGAKAKAEAAENKAKELNDRLLRTAAEYDNFRKRSAREADQKFNDGVSFAVTQILDILDTLNMAAAAPCADENYKKGVTMTLDKAAKAMEKLNISEIEAMDREFDPNLMNAVQQIPVEGKESGTVVQVFQKGYKLGDKIIRHATVVVAE